MIGNITYVSLVIILSAIMTLTNIMIIKYIMLIIIISSALYLIYFQRKTTSGLIENKTDSISSGLANKNGQHEGSKLVQKIDILKSGFLANMSHELRTPLNSIIGFSQMLHDEVMGQVNDQQKRYLSNVLNSSKQLELLIGDILDLAKIESGKAEVHIEEFDVKEIISNILIELGEIAEQKQINVKVNLQTCPNTIKADRMKIKQVMYNLLSNAIKFTPNNGNIEIGCHRNNGNNVFSVSDTGIGIREEDIDKIFSSFEQADASYTKTYQGTGLGLALVKFIVQMHGGTVNVESTLGKGSTFMFTIPSDVRVVKLEQ